MFYVSLFAALFQGNLLQGVFVAHWIFGRIVKACTWTIAAKARVLSEIAINGSSKKVKLPTIV